MTAISQLRDFYSLTPVTTDYFHNRNISVVDSRETHCQNYMSPSRRDFYKIVFIEKGEGFFSIGTKKYFIEDSTILFLDPGQIISWRSASYQMTGYYCLYKKRFAEAFKSLKSAMDQHQLFSDPAKSVVRLGGSAAAVINSLFKQLHDQYTSEGRADENSMQACLESIISESIKSSEFAASKNVSPQYKDIHNFFQLLKEETSRIDHQNPMSIRSPGEFAAKIDVESHYLNTIVKKHTGQSVNTHIRNWLLEESKLLIIQTDRPLTEIGSAVGFAEHQNFAKFFKRNTGIPPGEFRKKYGLRSGKKNADPASAQEDGTNSK
jgi:AraC-like DNA-binding protein